MTDRERFVPKTSLRRCIAVLVAVGVGALLPMTRAESAPSPPGSVVAWGDNYSGQLGNGSTADSSTAVSTTGLAGVTKITAGGAHTLALRTDGTVVAWGANNYGQLNGHPGPQRPAPVEVYLGRGVRDVAAGDNHSLAVLEDGRVVAWGWNFSGQLGNGTTDDSLFGPDYGNGLAGVKAVAAGRYHSLALRQDGTVVAWGDNYFGQLGDGTFASRSTPGPVKGLSGVKAIAAGVFHSLALLSDGTVVAWGDNRLGQLGRDTPPTNSPHALPVSGLAGVTSIASGSTAYHSFARLADGTLVAWGYNGEGQLGDGTTQHRGTPVPVKGLSGVTVTAMSAGSEHSLARLSDGRVAAWGRNLHGQLGDGTRTDRLLPVTVLRVSGVTAIGAGESHSVAVLGDGPRASVDQFALDFGTQRPGSSTSRTASVRNLGDVPLAVDGVTIAGSDPAQFAKTADSCSGAPVAPMNTCSITVVFQPSSSGNKSGSLVIASNDPSSPHTVPLRGTGAAPSPSPAPPPPGEPPPVAVAPPPTPVGPVLSGLLNPLTDTLRSLLQGL